MSFSFHERAFRTIYLVGCVACTPVIVDIFIRLYAFPSLSKFIYMAAYIVLYLKAGKQFFPLLIIVSYLHGGTTFFAALAIDPAFPFLVATAAFLTLFSLVGSLRGYPISYFLLILTLPSLPLAILVSAYVPIPYLTDIFVLLALPTLVYALYDLALSCRRHWPVIVRSFRRVARGGMTLTNALLATIIVFLLYIRTFENAATQEAGRSLAKAAVADILEVFSEGTRTAFLEFFTISEYGPFLVFCVASFLLYSLADHHAQIWHKMSYRELLWVPRNKVLSPIPRTSLGLGFGLVSFFLYWWLLIYTFPVHLSYFVSPITSQTIAIDVGGGLLLGVASAVLYGLLVGKSRIKTQLLRWYLSRNLVIRSIRFALLFGPSTIIAPFFAWETILSTAVLVLIAFALIS